MLLRFKLAFAVLVNNIPAFFFVSFTDVMMKKCADKTLKSFSFRLKLNVFYFNLMVNSAVYQKLTNFVLRR